MISKPVLRRLVELSCLAPSVHNTQPWRWRWTGETLRLYGDHSRLLPREDPLGRNLTISCGAALDHLRCAAQALGIDAEIARVADGRPDDLLAEVRLSPGNPSPTAADDIAVLRARCTDRRRFTSWPVPDATLAELGERARSRGAFAIAATDPGLRIRLELLTHRAHVLRALDQAAVEEQGQWVGERTADGVPLAVLPAQTTTPSPRFGTGVLDETRSFVESSDGVVILGGETDDPGSWLRTGEGLSTMWLQATRDGLSVVPLSLPIEVPAVRAELTDDVLEEGFNPHLLVRIGWQAIGRSELPRTPRRPVDDVLDA